MDTFHNYFEDDIWKFIYEFSKNYSIENTYCVCMSFYIASNFNFTDSNTFNRGKITRNILSDCFFPNKSIFVRLICDLRKFVKNNSRTPMDLAARVS